MSQSKSVVVPESHLGVCLWRLPSDHSSGGGYIADEKKNYLSLEGVVGDKRIEKKMREAAMYWLNGEAIGEPYWVRGARQITDAEADDMQERLESGLIPDWEEAARIAMKDGQNGHN